MARISAKDRLAPPLMHAFRRAYEERDARKRLDLRDEAGDRVIAARRLSPRAAVAEPMLRAEVARDIADLLNTTQLAAAESLAAFPAVRRSVLNYGIPDLVHRTTDEGGVRDIAAEIATALKDFEPRLDPDSIAAQRDNTLARGELKVRFLIRADLRCDPVDVPLEFVADVELDSGAIRIARL